jgi:hypothetical protein
MKGTTFRKAQQIRHLADGHFRLSQITHRQVFAHLIQQLLMRGAMIAQLPLQSSPAHAELFSHALERRISTVQFFFDYSSEPFNQRVLVRILCQQFLSVPIKHRKQTRIGFHDRQAKRRRVEDKLIRLCIEPHGTAKDAFVFGAVAGLIVLKADTVRRPVRVGYQSAQHRNRGKSHLGILTAFNEGIIEIGVNDFSGRFPNFYSKTGAISPDKIVG